VSDPGVSVPAAPPPAAEVVIKVRDNGPYLVRGAVTLIDAEGHQYRIDGPDVALCRCGQSATKPFCDASHRQTGFASCERAGAERATTD
jgi:CDGSH-type Zn-finger protein